MAIPRPIPANRKQTSEGRAQRVDTPAGPQLLRSDLPPATVRHARRRSGELPALPAPLADPPAPQPTHTRLRRAKLLPERRTPYHWTPPDSATPSLAMVMTVKLAPVYL